MRIGAILLLVSAIACRSFEVVGKDTVSSEDQVYWNEVAEFHGKILLKKESNLPRPMKTVLAVFDPAKPISDFDALPSKQWNMKISGIFEYQGDYYTVIDNSRSDYSGFIPDSGFYLAKVIDYDSIKILEKIDFSTKQHDYGVFPLGGTFLMVDYEDTSHVAMNEYDLSGGIEWKERGNYRIEIREATSGFLRVRSALKSKDGKIFLAGTYRRATFDGVSADNVSTLLRLNSQGRLDFERRFDLESRVSYLQFLDDEYTAIHETKKGDIVAIGLGVASGTTHFMYLNKYSKDGDSIKFKTRAVYNPILQTYAAYDDEFIVGVSDAWYSYKYFHFDENLDELSVDTLKIGEQFWRDKFHSQAVVGDAVYILIGQEYSGRCAYSLLRNKLPDSHSTAVSRRKIVPKGLRDGNKVYNLIGRRVRGNGNPAKRHANGNQEAR